MKNKENTSNNISAIIAVLFMICPIFSFIYIIHNAYKGRYNGLIWLSLSMSIVAISTPAFADLYRHTLLYFSYENYMNTGFIQSNELDFIFYTLTNLFAQNGIPFEFVSAIFVFVCYQIAFFLFHRTIESDYGQYWSNKVKFFVFLIFFLMVPFIAIMNGLRMATASYIAALGWYHFYHNNNVKGILLYLTACGMHFGSLLFLPLIIYMLLPQKKKEISYSIFILGMIFLFISGSILLRILPTSFIATLNMEKQVTGYMENSVERFDERMSFNGLIAMYLERLPLLFVFLLTATKKINLKDKENSILYVIFSLMFLYHPFTVLFQRYAFFATPIVIFLACKAINNMKHRPLKFVRCLFFVCCIYTLSYMYGYRKILMSTNFHNLLIPPVYTALTTDTAENFKDALIPK